MQVVDREEPSSRELFGLEEMADVATTVSVTRAARAGDVDRLLVANVFGSLQGDIAIPMQGANAAAANASGFNSTANAAARDVIMSDTDINNTVTGNVITYHAGSGAGNDFGIRFEGTGDFNNLTGINQLAFNTGGAAAIQQTLNVTAVGNQDFQ